MHFIHSRQINISEYFNKCKQTFLVMLLYFDMVNIIKLEMQFFLYMYIYI